MFFILKYFDFKVVLALEYWPFEDDRGMAQTAFNDVVIFYLDVIRFSDDGFQFYGFEFRLIV